MGKLSYKPIVWLLVVDFFEVRCACDDNRCDVGENLSLDRSGHSLLQTRRSQHTAALKLNQTKVSLQDRQLHLAMGKPSDIGNWEPLRESGFQYVAATCCYLEMEKFIRRLIASLDLDVCDEAGLVQLLPEYTTCQTGQKDLVGLTNHIMRSVPPAACPFVAQRGACPNEISPECRSVVDSSRRRQCTPRFKSVQQTYQDCPLPEGAIWCQAHLKDSKEVVMAVYDWDVTEDWVSYHICHTGFWEVDDASAFGRAGHMLDIGANIGFYSFALAKAGWKVTAFEPQASNLALMRATACRNPEVAANIRIHDIGLGGTQRECAIKVAPNNVGNGHVICEDRDLSTLPVGYANDYIDRNRFTIRRLDDVLQQQGVERVDFVKMDVEGYELQVLQGAPNLFSKFHPRIFKSEVWGSMIGGEGIQFINILDAAGYQYYRDDRCKNAFDAHSEVLNGFAEIVACLPSSQEQEQDTATSTADVRRNLEAMTKGALIKRAASMNVDNVVLETAIEGSKDDLIKLILHNGSQEATTTATLTTTSTTSTTTTTQEQKTTTSTPNVRAELEAMTKGALIKRAASMDVDNVALETATEGTKDDLINLILHNGSQEQEITTSNPNVPTELEAMTKGDLIKRAASMDIGNVALETAAEGTKDDVINLILHNGPQISSAFAIDEVFDDSPKSSTFAFSLSALWKHALEFVPR